MKYSPFVRPPVLENLVYFVFCFITAKESIHMTSLFFFFPVSFFVYLQPYVYEIPGIPYRTCRICLMFSLVGGYIKVCIQLFNDTTFNIFLVEIYLSDISDGPDSKTGTAIRACSPQRLLLFDVMKKVALVHRVVIFQAMEEKSVSQKFMERKYLHFLSFFLTWSKSLWFVGTNSTLKYAWCLKGTKSL